MTTALIAPPEQGQLVSIRSRNWIVNDVAPSTLPTEGLHGLGNGQTLLTLSSIEDDGLGEELQVVWELEPGCRIIEKVALLDAANDLGIVEEVSDEGEFYERRVGSRGRRVERTDRRVRWRNEGSLRPRLRRTDYRLPEL